MPGSALLDRAGAPPSDVAPAHPAPRPTIGRRPGPRPATARNSRAAHGPQPHPARPRHARRRSGLKRAATLCTAVIAFVAGVLFLGTMLGRWGAVTVLTGSMRPVIQPGDLVIETPEPVTAVRVGQILVFHPPDDHGIRVAHRVISVARDVHGTTIRTKGDANNVADPWHAHLNGTTAWHVVTVVPKLGYLTMFSHTRLGHLVLVLVLVGTGTAIALAVVVDRPGVKARRGSTSRPRRRSTAHPAHTMRSGRIFSGPRRPGTTQEPKHGAALA
ncbi:MAG: signal peptidase I [Actinomycetota bacterium]|nr:signal peptidase I [Actinomycetota bacterium]